MFKVAGLVGVLLVLSKVLGLARDIVIAHYFGTSYIADGFNLAYMLTGNFFILFSAIGGPFYNSIVSMLPRVRLGLRNLGSSDAEIVQGAKVFVKNTLWKSFLALALISVAIFFAKDYLLGIFISQDSKPETFNVASLHISFLLPLIAICGPIGILYGVLNAYKKYVAPSFSSAALNIVLIITIFLMGDIHSGVALAIGTTLGGIVSLIMQVPGLLGTELFRKPEAALSESVQAFLNKARKTLGPIRGDYYHILYPAIFGTFLTQGLVLIDSYFCDQLEVGSWTAIVMSNRLVQMPLGVLLTAFLVPVFPRISELASNHDVGGIKKQIRKALGALVLLCIPATLVGMFFSEEIIRILFERGEFDHNSTTLVSTAFFYMCITIIPYVFRDTVTRIFLSYGDSKTPLAITATAIPMKFALNWALVGKLGLIGIPIATSCVLCINFLLLSILLKRKTGEYICF